MVLGAVGLARSCCRDEEHPDQSQTALAALQRNLKMMGLVKAFTDNSQHCLLESTTLSVLQREDRKGYPLQTGYPLGACYRETGMRAYLPFVVPQG